MDHTSHKGLSFVSLYYPKLHNSLNLGQRVSTPVYSSRAPTPLETLAESATLLIRRIL